MDDSSGSKQRHWSDDYVRFGFIKANTKKDLPDQASCLICGTTLSNASLNPAKLKRHLETNHESSKGKSMEYFQSMSKNMQKTKTNMFN